MSIKVGIYTLGCRVNQYESGAIGEMLIQRGYDVLHTDRGCDYYIVNTCAVTAESERKSRQVVRRMAKNGKVVVIGCASQLNKTPFEIENVVFIGGCREKQAAVEAILNESDERIERVPDMSGAEYENFFVNGKSGLFSDCRAFIKIEDGCNGKCSYCVIPSCRGKVRSRPLDDVIDESERLVRCGYKELILTGIEVGAYNKAPLSELIRRVSLIKGLERLRFGSLSPNVINKSFLEAAAESKAFMPHLHLSLQSCSDDVLAGMRRPYRKNDIFGKITLIREFIPDCALSADIIVGFPGETEDQFVETLRAVDELSIFHVHSFPYSERAGTAAAEMEASVPVNVRHERNNRLIETASHIRERIISGLIGQKRSVLVEKISGGTAVGHTEDYMEACFPDRGYAVGDIADVKIIGSDDGIIKAITEEECL